jgi:primosomal protein N' (replication factor Y)
MDGKAMYASVLLPLKLGGGMTYAVPEEMRDGIFEGSRVEVTMHFRKYLGVVESVGYELPEGIDPSKVKPIGGIEPFAGVSRSEIEFWRLIADYYMCTVGEVYKAAYSGAFSKQIEYLAGQMAERGDETPAEKLIREDAEESMLRAVRENLPKLSELQLKATAQAHEAFAEGKAVLLDGVTGSGKTEVYISLAAESLAAGRSVLYMVPEIAMSRQLCDRLKKVFGTSLMVFHSQQTSAAKKRLYEALKNDSAHPRMVLGTRSAVFLPFERLGLVIVDEEHDASYKQEEPAPRYNGRDAALMLARSRGAKVILGSATPSLESLYNAGTGKFERVALNAKYFGEEDPEIEVVDTIKARKLHDMRGSLSNKLINEIRKCLDAHEQVMVFRSRRSYAPVVQCTECGETVKCPNCDVNLSYHKYNNTLACHYCDYVVPFDPHCPSCGAETLVPRGAGTEKVEEELKAAFPDAVVDRFDADVFQSKTKSNAVLKDFAEGRTDILVGTQMITKGFDFENLALVAVISGDSLLSYQDFRNDERAMEILSQLRGRAGRRRTRGRMLIQTDRPAHPVFGAIQTDRRAEMMEERKRFGYPPFTRMMKLIIKDEHEGRLGRVGEALAFELSGIKGLRFSGPVAAERSKLKGLYVTEIWIKLPRNAQLPSLKAAVAAACDRVRGQMDFQTDIVPDVDPL